jgi:hypothetical protein
MSSELLGTHFDIHGGGQDLQFPHHENEIAQSEGAHGCRFVNYWMHNGFVRVDDEKMSKSLGNFFTIREVLKQYDAEVVRFFILRALPQPAELFGPESRRREERAHPPVHGAQGFFREFLHRLERTPREALQGSDGRRLRHAGSGRRAFRAGQPRQQR